jgi:hypothetical protein
MSNPLEIEESDEYAVELDALHMSHLFWSW